MGVWRGSRGLRTRWSRGRDSHLPEATRCQLAVFSERVGSWRLRSGATSPCVAWVPGQALPACPRSDGQTTKLTFIPGTGTCRVTLTANGSRTPSHASPPGPEQPVPVRRLSPCVWRGPGGSWRGGRSGVFGHCPSGPSQMEADRRLPGSFPRHGDWWRQPGVTGSGEAQGEAEGWEFVSGRFTWVSPRSPPRARSPDPRNAV